MSSEYESEMTRSEKIENKVIEVSRQEENSISTTVRIHINVSDDICSLLSEIQQMKIELVMFMYMFANMMTMVSLTSLIMDKVCLVHLGESQDVCFNLKDHNSTKTEVEKQANNYSVGVSLMQMLPSSILACFIGAWSDENSRKIPLIMALIGTTINGLGATLLASIFYSRVEYLLIPSAFAGVSGGAITIMTVLYSYASDTTALDKRTIKYAFLEFAFGMAMPLGQSAGGCLFHWFGYIPVFLVSTCCHILSLVFVTCKLQETKGLDNKDNWRLKLGNLWSFKPVLESIRATIKPRPNKGRLQILLLILAMSLAVLSYASNLFGLLSGLATLAGRSRISKVTSKNDIGKVFAFLTTAETILPILSTVVASQVFNATLNVYPGLIYLGLGGLLLVPLSIFSWLSRLPTIDFEEMHNEDEEQ